MSLCLQFQYTCAYTDIQWLVQVTGCYHMLEKPSVLLLYAWKILFLFLLFYFSFSLSLGLMTRESLVI